MSSSPSVDNPPEATTDVTEALVHDASTGGDNPSTPSALEPLPSLPLPCLSRSLPPSRLRAKRVASRSSGLSEASLRSVGQGAETTSAKPPNKKGPRRHPFSTRFEAPNWQLLGTHVLFCLGTVPVIYGISKLADRKALPTARSIVGLTCWLIGFILSTTLTTLARNLIEAAIAYISIARYPRNTQNARCTSRTRRLHSKKK